MRTLVRGIVAVLVVVLAASLNGTGVPADAAPGPAGAARVASARVGCEPFASVSGAVMFGDSITRRSRRQLRAAGARRWKIDAVGGRPVGTLPRLLRALLATRVRAPRLVVIALGTNPTPGWRAANYRAAVDLLPARTRVVLVTPYRHRATRSTYDAYARAMHAIAAERPRTTVADWRAAAAARPGTLLKDRYHPSDRGKRVFAALVVKAAHRAELLGQRRDAVMADRRRAGACG